MMDIIINKSKLAKLLTNANYGSTDEAIYVNPVSGECFLKHNTADTTGFVKLLDLYNITYDNCDSYSEADWESLIDEWICSDWVITAENSGIGWFDVEYYITAE